MCACVFVFVLVCARVCVLPACEFELMTAAGQIFLIKELDEFHGDIGRLLLTPNRGLPTT